MSAVFCHDRGTVTSQTALPDDRILSLCPTPEASWHRHTKRVWAISSYSRGRVNRDSAEAVRKSQSNHVSRGQRLTVRCMDWETRSPLEPVTGDSQLDDTVRPQPPSDSPIPSPAKTTAVNAPPVQVHRPGPVEPACLSVSCLVPRHAGSATAISRWVHSRSTNRHMSPVGFSF